MMMFVAGALSCKSRDFSRNRAAVFGTRNLAWTVGIPFPAESDYFSSLYTANFKGIFIP